MNQYFGRIGIDQDQVVADLHFEWVRRYNYDYNDNLKPSDIKEWNWHKMTHPNCQEKIYTYLDDPELFANLPVIEGSQEVIHKLSNNFEIFFITSPFNLNNVLPKGNWLSKHFEFIPSNNHVYTRNKSIANVDWLIDDKAANFRHLQGVGLLYDAPHNQKEYQFTRVMDWKDIDEYFNMILEAQV